MEHGLQNSMSVKDWLKILQKNLGNRVVIEWEDAWADIDERLDKVKPKIKATEGKLIHVSSRWIALMNEKSIKPDDGYGDKTCIPTPYITKLTTLEEKDVYET